MKKMGGWRGKEIVSKIMRDAEFLLIEDGRLRLMRERRGRESKGVKRKERNASS